MSKKNKYSSFWIDNSFFGGDVDTTSENSTDIMRLVSYKRAVSNFVSIVTGQSIPVKFEQRGDSYTDGKTVTISSKINETDFDPIVGLALHEGSHVKLTDFDSIQYIIDAEYAKSNLGNWTEYWVNLFKKHNPDVELGQNFPNYHMDYFLKKYASPKIKDLVNVIEDRRIDHYIFTNAPGYKGYYQSLYDKFFNSKNIDKGLLSSEYRTNDWNSYFFRIINFINKNRDLNALPLLRQVWNMINLKNISRLNNTMEVVDLAVEIFKLMVMVNPMILRVVKIKKVVKWVVKWVVKVGKVMVVVIPIMILLKVMKRMVTLKEVKFKHHQEMVSYQIDKKDY
jgi:hypothetical protein